MIVHFARRKAVSPKVELYISCPSPWIASACVLVKHLYTAKLLFILLLCLQVYILDSTGEVAWTSHGWQEPLYAPEEADPDFLPNFNAFSAPGAVTVRKCSVADEVICTFKIKWC